MTQRVPVFATLLTLASLAVLCGLGAWQLQRQEAKRVILAKLEAEYASDALGRILSGDDLARDFEYRRGTISGRYLFDKQVFVGPRPHGNFPGFHVITPLQLDDGSVLLVNRGWVSEHWPQEGKEDYSRDRVTLAGLARVPMVGNPFTPPNDPAKDRWYNADPAGIAAAKDLGATWRYIFYPEKGEGPDEYPLPVDARPDIANNHLLYAIFWFTMAGALLVIYFLRFFTSKGRQ